jgi:hypothetical protein
VNELPPSAATSRSLSSGSRPLSTAPRHRRCRRHPDPRRTGQERRLEAVCADAVPRTIPTLVDLVPCCSSGEYLDPPRCTTRLSCLHVVSTALGPDHAAEAGAGCGEVVLKQR